MAAAERSTGDNGQTCLCRICESVRETIRRIFIVLEKYGWLLDAYIVNFYVDDSWNGLPNSWRNFLEDVTPKELGTWIEGGGSRRGRVWPLSLLAIRRVVGVLQIDRDHKGEMILKCENVQRDGRKTERDRQLRGNVDRGRIIGSFSDRQKLRNLLSKHVKAKKIHEVDAMAQIIADCAASANSECAVDVGAGMGHLARKLAYEYEICVTCVEQQSSLSDQARKLDARFESIVLKQRPDTTAQKPSHLSAKIERKASESSQLMMERLERNFETEFQLNGESYGFGLIGLHPCGDLATTLLELYAESDCARFICVAGCCYMKLTLNSQSYPLSGYLRSSEANELSYTALEVACHAVENHCRKLKSADYWELKVHAYRAALEVVLAAKSPSLRHAHLKSVKLRETMTFREYCVAATRSLPPGSLTEMETPQTAGLLEYWERVVVFGSLRSMLAPLVESVVLLDRFLYLSERDLSPRLKAVFDPLISPRNFVLTSIK